MSVRPHKKGIRALGISESFVRGINKQSVLAGVVMRADMILDGFAFSQVQVGGLDSTQKVIDMYLTLKRDDINVLLLNGCVISWYNVIDLNTVADKTGLPLICVTYKESKGLEAYFEENFPGDWRERVKVYHRNGPRIPLKLRTGYTVFTRFINVGKNETLTILNKFTISGAISEPLRVARLLARSIIKSVLCTKFKDVPFSEKNAR